ESGRLRARCVVGGDGWPAHAGCGDPVGSGFGQASYSRAHGEAGASGLKTSILTIGTLARIAVFHLLPVPVRLVQWTKNHRVLSARRDRKPQAAGLKQSTTRQVWAPLTGAAHKPNEPWRGDLGPLPISRR
ncbi:MAG: hypothetical protein MUP27_12470, partial [Desulfobacterales bacterium]|nr:hypothetical protein [Desulfobacterales bacterium]